MKFDVSEVPGELTLGNQMAGGVVSDVRAATWLMPEDTAPRAVVVKYTSSEVGEVKPPFDADADGALLEAAAATHDVDAKVLFLLRDNPYIRVPKLLHYRGQTTIMEDFRSRGYALMQDELVQGRLPASSASILGNMLGHLQLRLRESDCKGLPFAEDPEVQARERLEELFPLLRDNLPLYYQIRDKFLEATGSIHVDGHPKNIGVDPDGNVILIDFGRMIQANEQYPAPNFAAHVALAMLGGLISPEAGSRYIREFVKAYRVHVPLEDIWFVRFFLAELVHRGLALRWIDGRMIGKVPRRTYKKAVYGLFLDAIEDATTIDELLALVCQFIPAQAGAEG